MFHDFIGFTLLETNPKIRQTCILTKKQSKRRNAIQLYTVIRCWELRLKNIIPSYQELLSCKGREADRKEDRGSHVYYNENRIWTHGDCAD